LNGVTKQKNANNYFATALQSKEREQYFATRYKEKNANNYFATALQAKEREQLLCNGVTKQKNASITFERRFLVIH